MVNCVKEIPQSLFQVHHQDGEVDGGVAGVRKARHPAVQSIAPLGLAELALDRVPFTGFIPFQKLLLVVEGLVLRWSTELWTVHRNAMLLAEGQVRAVSVNLVRQDPLWVESVSFPVALAAFDQGLGLVERVPRQFLDPGVAVIQAQGELGAKLGLGGELAAHDRPNPGLADAHDPVFDGMTLIVVHLPLLAVHFLENDKPGLLPGCEIACFSQIRDMAKVSAQVLELRLYGLPDQALAWTLVSDQQKIVLPGRLPIGARLCFRGRCFKEFVDQFLGKLPGVIQNAGIGREMDVGRCAGRIQDQRAVVVVIAIAVITVFGWWRRILLLGRDDRLVDFSHRFGRKALPKRCQLAGVKRRLVQKLLHADEVLAVGILRDHRHRVLVGKMKLFLDHQRAKGHPALDGRITGLLTNEVLGVLLVDQVPWDNLGQLHPAVFGEDPGTGKSAWEVMKCQLPASSTIHTPLQMQGFEGVLLNSHASIIPNIAFKRPIRNALRISQ